MRVRIPTDRSILHALTVERAPAQEVGTLIAERHYLHSMPGVVRVCFGVRLGDELVGACVFTAGARHAHRLLAGARPRDIATLSRFWMADGLPPNNESRVLAMIMRQLRHEDAFRLVVSFADPAAGHIGTIYQAAGFLYLGTTEPERYFELDGVRIHPRSASERYGSNSVAHMRRTGLAVVARISPPKHRYACLLDPSWRWRLRARPLRYPKRVARGPPSSRSAKVKTVCGELPLPADPTDGNCHDYYYAALLMLSTHSGRSPMTPRKRDYKAEYARRIERGLAQGLSRSQARGHPRHYEPYRAEIVMPRPWDRTLEDGLGQIREGRSLAAAARSIGVAPERLRSYVTRTGVARKENRRWQIGPDYRQRQVLVHTAGRSIVIIVPSFADASRVSSYMAHVRWFLEANDPMHIAKFTGQGVTDIEGVFHPFEVRENVLYRLNETATESYEEVYKIVV